ncbi:MAG: UDP-glucose 4-epimerase GalE [Blastopirellula sp.]|nr:MAG: UDP-glucose 4-epimerase GalE [Blastopirellula sp.]
MKILLTGGAGYIGSHTCIELLNAGHEVVVVDNLMNSKRESLTRVEQITGKSIDFHEFDLCDKQRLDQFFSTVKLDGVIHFAGLKAVGESVAKPLFYYQNNLISTLNLLECMKKHGVKNLVFSSSATVYGSPKTVPITEDFPLSTTNPYGRTKLMIEEILTDFHHANQDFAIVNLRYFNPVGAHESGSIGEDPNGIPNNLFPYITQVAIGKLEKLSVFGDDYDTVDGTGVRDYIHVLDLANGHLKALEKIEGCTELLNINLGTGKGYSVLEAIQAFEQASGKSVSYQIVDRRPGDIAACYADPSYALQCIGWQATRDLACMCRDSWNWQSQNPQGY